MQPVVKSNAIFYKYSYKSYRRFKIFSTIIIHNLQTPIWDRTYCNLQMRHAFHNFENPHQNNWKPGLPNHHDKHKEGSWILSSPWPRSITYLASLSSSILRCDLHLVSGNHNRSQTSHSDAPLPFGRKLISWAIVLWRWRENPKPSRGKMLPSPMPPDPQATKIVITAYNAFSCFCRCQTLNYCQYFANKPRPRRGKLININNV